MSEPNPPDSTTRKSAPPAVPETVASEVTGALEPSAPQSARVPTKIGRFEVRRLLGEGAFARVFLGFDAQLEREVAIKVPKSDELTPEFQDTFLRENRLAAIIHHPNVCPVFEVGTDGGLPYIVMRVIPDTLAGLLKRSTAPLSPRTAVAITRKLALGLAAAHAQKVIHRDLKPANVLYDEANREVLIADFGLARFVDQATAASNGVPKGTPAYMAPEQARGQAEAVGPHSDVYSLGVILYELLTGRVPFHGSVWEVMRDHCETAAVPVSSARSGLDVRLDALCQKAMSKNPADRYGSAKDFATALSEYLRTESSDSVTAPAGPAVPPPLPADSISGGGATTTAASTKSSKPRARPVPPPLPPGLTKGSGTTTGTGATAADTKRGKPRARPVQSFEPEVEPASAPTSRRLLPWVLIGCGSAVGLLVLAFIVVALIAGLVGGSSKTRSTGSEGPYPAQKYEANKLPPQK